MSKKILGIALLVVGLFLITVFIGQDKVYGSPSPECWEVTTYKGCYWKDAGESCTLFFGNQGKLCMKVCDTNLVCSENGRPPRVIDNYEKDTGERSCVATFGVCR